jgi:hypothetical protein
MLHTTRTSISRECLVTILRPSGKTETVRHPKIANMTPKKWDIMKEAMEKANKGECLEYKNITKNSKIEMTAEQQRKDLNEQLSVAIDEERDAMAQCVATSVMPDGYKEMVDEIKTIESEILDFDAVHPEIKENIKSARQAFAQKHMWD